MMSQYLESSRRGVCKTKWSWSSNEQIWADAQRSFILRIS